jgi:hypothetical protein
MDILQIVIGISLVLLILIIYTNDTYHIEGYDMCEHPDSNDDQIGAMGKTAQDACNKISSRAEEIEAEYGGIQGVMQNIPGAALFNPNNYAAGDNTTNDMMRNIINVNMSSCDVQKIVNDCKNSSANMQTNIIDNTDCKWCETHECKLDNINQSNAATINQRCVAQSAIETLLKKKNSIDAQALAKVLQKTDKILSGDNTVSTESCNVLNYDLSSKRYLENIARCANELGIDQKNSIKFCGSVANVVQDNQFNSFQECLSKSGVSTVTELEAETSIKKEIDAEQESSGLDITPVSIVAIIFIALCILFGGTMIFVVPMLQTTDEKNTKTSTDK